MKVIFTDLAVFDMLKQLLFWTALQPLYLICIIYLILRELVHL